MLGAGCCFCCHFLFLLLPLLLHLLLLMVVVVDAGQVMATVGWSGCVEWHVYGCYSCGWFLSCPVPAVLPVAL